MSYSIIPQSVSVDNKTIEKNITGEIQVKNHIADTRVLTTMDFEIISGSINGDRIRTNGDYGDFFQMNNVPFVIRAKIYVNESGTYTLTGRKTASTGMTYYINDVSIGNSGAGEVVTKTITLNKGENIFEIRSTNNIFYQIGHHYINKN